MGAKATKKASRNKFVLRKNKTSRKICILYIGAAWRLTILRARAANIDVGASARCKILLPYEYGDAWERPQ